MTGTDTIQNVLLFVLTAVSCAGNILGLSRYWSGEIKTVQTPAESGPPSSDETEARNGDDQAVSKAETTAEPLDMRPGKKTQILFFGMIVVFTFASVAFQRFFYHNDFLWCLRALGIVTIVWPCGLIDRYERRIPNKVILLGIAIWAVIFIISSFSHPEEWLRELGHDLAGGGGILVAFLIFMLISRGGIGMGDVKLFAVIALFTGLLEVVPILFLVLIISFFAAVYFLLSKKKKRTDFFPFGPCILAGTILAMILTSA